MNFLGIMNGLWNFAGIVQRLVCKPSKLEMRVRFPLPAPHFARCFVWQATFRQGENGQKFWACAGVGEPGQTVNLLSYD